MQANSLVLVTVDDRTVPGLLLKWRQDGAEGLVTYEIDGRVATEWVAVDRVRPESDAPRPPEPVEG